jgi:hypothetical protein
MPKNNLVNTAALMVILAIGWNFASSIYTSWDRSNQPSEYTLRQRAHSAEIHRLLDNIKW